MDNKLKEFQENLVKDLIKFEENNLLTEQQLEQITDIYSKVYDIFHEIKSL
jgi:hypothetical protein